MKSLVNRVFYSTDNLKDAAAGLAFAALALAVLVFGVRIASNASTVAPVPASPAPSVHHPELVPTTPLAHRPSGTAAAPTPGSLQTALQAADAFLAGDVARFARVALPAAVDVVAEADAGDRATLGRLTLDGEPQLVDDGTDIDARRVQTWQIPTDGGPLQLVMVLMGDRWKCEAIRYVADGQVAP